MKNTRCSENESLGSEPQANAIGCGVVGQEFDFAVDRVDAVIAVQFDSGTIPSEQKIMRGLKQFFPRERREV